jgi:alkylation response protein AidB-like acyl-CoA dehydrogenase
MEALGRACAGTMWAASVSTALCGKLLSNLGRSDHHREWLVGIVSGSRIGCVAGTERGSGCDQRSYQTVLRRAGSGYRLTGEKLRCGNAPVADVALVLAHLEGSTPGQSRLAWAIVDLGLPGMSRESLDHMGLRAMPWGNLAFDEVEVAAEDVIPDASMDQVLRSIELGQLFQSFCSIGIAEAAFDASLSYMKERHAFNRPIAHLQTVHARLADMRVEIDAARLVALHAASLMTANCPAGEVVVMARIHATEMAVRVADAAMRTFAGWGPSTDLPVERLVSRQPVQRACRSDHRPPA